MKILIVDLLWPECTRFINPKNVGGFFCGKDLQHYKIFAVKDCNMQPIEFATSNVLEIQKLVDDYCDGQDS